MSTYENSVAPCCEPVARPSFQSGFLGFVEQVFQGLRRRAEQRLRRQAFLNMANLDERMLDDIGLTRGDVETAASLPLEINASLAVRQIAADRRAAEQRMRRR